MNITQRTIKSLACFDYAFFDLIKLVNSVELLVY